MEGHRRPDEDEDRLERIERHVRTIDERTRKMAITQEQLDTDLAALATAVDGVTTAEQELTAAVDAWVTAHPGVDLTVEDQAVLDAAAKASAASQALADELTKIAPPAPPPAPAP